VSARRGKRLPDPKLSKTQATIAVSAVALAIIGLVVGIAVWSSSGSNKPPPTHVEYARLFDRAVVQKTPISVLKQWPKPYQTFGDNFQDRCFEWFDRPNLVYTLCFKNGVLAIKSNE
jgi:hypothetical protein